MRLGLYQILSIRTRFILISILPITAMAFSWVGYTYYSRIAEVKAELAEHGRLIATALAGSSDYSLSFGNFSDVTRVIESLVKTDPSIYSISIIDGQSKDRVHVSSTQARSAERDYIEIPIKTQNVALDSFPDDRSPNISSNEYAPIQANGTQTAGKIIGYVRVTMSSKNLLLKQKHRIYIQSTLVLLSSIGTVLFELWLALSITRPMAIAIAALRAIRGGDYTKRIAVTTGGEIGDLQLTINEMSESLGQSKQDLENKVLARTKELEASRNEALKADAEKRRLFQKVDSAVEDERKSIAVEIHDELNATLIGARLNSQRIIDLSAEFAHSPAVNEISERAQATIKLAAALYASARNIVRRLRPETLDMLGLQGAVEEMLYNYNASHNDCRFDFNSTGEFSTLDDSLAIAAFRLIQEALSNVIKHARASKASVSICADHQENILYISITDNGIGFDISAHILGIGIIGMRERVYAFNGYIGIESEIGMGTIISIQLPLTKIPQ